MIGVGYDGVRGSAVFNGRGGVGSAQSVCLAAEVRGGDLQCWPGGAVWISRVGAFTRLLGIF